MESFPKPVLEPPSEPRPSFTPAHRRTGWRRSRPWAPTSISATWRPRPILLLAALHHVGLVALTHTPNPLGFLNAILERPANERPVMLVVTGYPASGAQVPSLGRKTLREFVTFR
jgi:hypothetical protein